MQGREGFVRVKGRKGRIRKGKGRKVKGKGAENGGCVVGELNRERTNEGERVGAFQ